MAKKLSMNQNTKNHDKSDVDLSKRRLGKLGLLATPVLLSVAGRPAWGGNCSPSAVLSHTHASHHPEAVNCKFGCSPGYWKKCRHDWSGLTAYYKNQSFCDVFFGLDTANCPFSGKTLHQVLSRDVDDIKPVSVSPGDWASIKEASVHAIAGILNASAHQADGGYLGQSPFNIIDAYYSAYMKFVSSTIGVGAMPSTAGLGELRKILNQYPDGTGEEVICMYNAYGETSSGFWNNSTRSFDL